MEQQSHPFEFIDSRWGNQLVWPVVRHYENGNIALQLLSQSEEGWEEPWATASVNLCFKLDPAYVLLKTWSENEEIEQLLIEAGIIEPEVHGVFPTGYTVAYGFKFTEKFYKEMVQNAPE